MVEAEDNQTYEEGDKLDEIINMIDEILLIFKHIEKRLKKIGETGWNCKGTW